jgi:hypothetical protein
MTLYNDILLRVYSYVINYLSICKGLQSSLLGEEMEFLSLSLTGSWQGVEIFQDGHSEENTRKQLPCHKQASMDQWETFLSGQG